MAIVEVKVPQLSESVAEATLLQWKKKPGEAVEMDEILVEIETDKVVLEVPAPAAGVMAQLVKNDGEMCVAEEVIARIDTEGIVAVSPLPVTAVPAETPAPPQPLDAPQAEAGKMSGVAMPAAAKLMADNAMAAGSVPGTGKDGRVTRATCWLLWRRAWRRAWLPAQPWRRPLRPQRRRLPLRPSPRCPALPCRLRPAWATDPSSACP